MNKLDRRTLLKYLISQLSILVSVKTDNRPKARFNIGDVVIVNFPLDNDWEPQESKVITYKAKILGFVTDARLTYFTEYDGPAYAVIEENPDPAIPYHPNLVDWIEECYLSPAKRGLKATELTLSGKTYQT